MPKLLQLPNKDVTDLLKKGLNSLDFSCSEDQIHAFMTYLSELKKWNKAYNLTAIKRDEDIIFKHFLDSVLYLKAVKDSCMLHVANSKLINPPHPPLVKGGEGDFLNSELRTLPAGRQIASCRLKNSKNSSLIACLPSRQAYRLSLNVCDVGAGAGFPGIPIKILKPEINITLIESSRKKTAFLRHIIRTLALDNTTVLDRRVESMGQAYWKTFDVIVSRATFKINDFLKKACPYIREEGILVLSKGPGIDKELEKLKNRGLIKKIEPYVLSLKSGSTCLTAKRNLLILQCKKTANKL